MPDQNPAAITLPSPPAPPTPPNVETLSSQELAKVLTQWKEMARQLEKQAEKFEDQADDRPDAVAAQLKAASRQWHEQSLAIRAQADQMAAKGATASATAIFDQGGVSVVEQDGRTVIKKDGKTLVDVPSKGRDRSSRSDSSSTPAVPIVFIVFLFLFLIVKAIMRPIHARRGNLPGGAGAGPGLSAEDSATLQKIHRTVGQMERRVEALETILADPRRTAAFTAVTRPSTSASPSTSYESKV